MHRIFLICAFVSLVCAELGAQSNESVLTVAETIKFSRLREAGITTDEIAAYMLKAGDVGLPLSPAFRDINAILTPIFSGKLSEAYSKGIEKSLMIPAEKGGVDIVVSHFTGPVPLSVLQTASLWGVRFTSQLGSSGLQEMISTILNTSRGEWAKRPIGNDNWVFVPEKGGATHPFLDVIYLSRDGDVVLVWGVKGSEGTAYLLTPEKEKKWFASTLARKKEFEFLDLPESLKEKKN